MSIPDNVWRFIRYGILGVLSNTLGYLLFLSILRIPVRPEFASGSTYILVLSANYFVSRRFVFHSKSRHLTDVARYGFAYFVGFLVTVTSMSILSDAMDPRLAQFVVIVLSAVAIYSVLVAVGFGRGSDCDAD